jgi:ABC-type protease/lipase transport system fused ATPase/permease subunit
VSHILVLSEGKAAAYGPKDEVLNKVAKPQQAQAQAAQLQQPVLVRQSNVPATGT